MGTMLLRRATQIANRISREAAFEIERDDEDYPYRRRKKKIITLSAVATVNIDGEPTAHVAALRTALLEGRSRMFRLMNIGMTMRQALAVAQAQCGVSALVTERVMVVRQQQILETLLGEVAQTVFNEVEFNSQVMATQARLGRAVQAPVVAELSTPLLTAEDRAGLQRELTDLKRRLLDIDDRLAELNAQNKITMSDEDEMFLRENGIA